MNIFFKTFLVACTLFLSSISSQGQVTVWPGDVNNNGVVNGLDMLFLGLAFEAEGPARQDPVADWVGQDAELWDQSFFNGINYAYADCNGNGQIDQLDIVKGVKDNFGKTHGTIIPDMLNPGVAGSDPKLQLFTANTTVTPGSDITFQVSLGSETAPVEGFYGVAFTLKYDPTVLTPEDVEFSLDPTSWIDPSDEARVKTLTRVDEDNGLMSIAVTRTRQTGVDGFGEIGSFVIVIEDIIVGLEQEDVNTLVKVDSVWVMNDQMTLLPVVNDSLNLTIPKVIDTLSSINDINSTNVQVYPNPAGHQVWIDASETQIEQIELYDWMGRRLPVSYAIKQQKQFITLDHIPNGIYIISMTTSHGLQTERLVIQKE